MNGTSQIFVALLALWMPVQNALAWGEEGHRMVGNIASRYLNPKARAQVLVLLKDDRLADGQPSGRRTLGEIASWADEIRENDPKRPGHNLHFDNIPICGEGDYSKYCKNGQCASAQLDRQLDLLRDAESNSSRRNRALKWVVHLIGDIHQPLHAANRDDQGGNTIRVSYFGETDNPPYGPMKLHAIWDVHILQRLTRDHQNENAIVSAPISEQDRRQWEKGSIPDWVAESHEIARNFVYPALPVVVSCPKKISGIVIKIDQEYYSKAAPIIEIQLRKAGIRLAWILNETLGN
jgi:hypothetical protein